MFAYKFCIGIQLVLLYMPLEFDSSNTVNDNWTSYLAIDMFAC